MLAAKTWWELQPYTISCEDVLSAEMEEGMEKEAEQYILGGGLAVEVGEAYVGMPGKPRNDRRHDR